MEDEKHLEIENLNAEDLDVEDLERRVELAAAVGADSVWCNADCGNNVVIADLQTPVEA